MKLFTDLDIKTKYMFFSMLSDVIPSRRLYSQKIILGAKLNSLDNEEEDANEGKVYRDKGDYLLHSYSPKQLDTIDVFSLFDEIEKDKTC